MILTEMLQDPMFLTGAVVLVLTLVYMMRGKQRNLPPGPKPWPILAMKKLTLGTLRDIGVGKKSLEERIQDEAGMLCEVFESKEGKPHYYLDNCKMAVANIIAGIVYGNRMEYDDPVLEGLVENINTLFKDLNIFLPENFLPILRFLPGSKLMKVFKTFSELEKYAKSRIEEHRESFDPENIRDFVDLFLKHEETEDGAITEENLFRVIVELFNAGTDTTATTIIWAVAHLIRNPDIQDKCRSEINKVAKEQEDLYDWKTSGTCRIYRRLSAKYCDIVE